MIEFIATNWLNILLIVAFIAIVIFLIVKGEKKIIYKMLYVLVTEAEKKYGSGTGAIKFAEVMSKCYEKLPAVVKWFVSYGTLSRWIEDVLAKAKERWKEEFETNGL